MAGIIKKKKSAYGKRRKKKSKTYDAYTAAMADPSEATVDADVPSVVFRSTRKIYGKQQHSGHAPGPYEQFSSSWGG